MSAISTSVEVVDRVSGALNRITARLYQTTSAFGAVDRASDAAFSPVAIQAMTQEMYGYETRIQQLESDLVDANRRLEEMEQKTQEARNAADGLKRAFKAVGSAIGAIGIGRMVTQAIDYASDLQEVQNVVDVTFGQGSAVNDWSKTTLEAFGLNELSAKRFSGTMGAMLKSSGLTGSAVEEMSMKITELAGDMASFYNLEADEAFTKIRSGISGETEPLKQLGINMSVANLEAYALSQGINKAYNEMSQAEQVTLRYNYLLQTTKDSTGDFSRTSHSFANQVKLLKENWTSFTGELASNVLPILAFGIGALNNSIELLGNNWSWLAPIIAGVLGIMTVYWSVTKGVTIAQTVLKAVMGAFTAVQTFMSIGWGVLTGNTAAASAAQFTYNSALMACPLTWILMIIIAVIAAIYLIVAAINKVTGSTISATGIIFGAIATVGAAIWNIIVGLINGIIQFAWTYFVEPWIGIIEWILNVMNGGFDSFGDACKNLLGNVISWFLSLGKVVTKIIDAIFGTSWTDGLNSLQNEVLSWGKNENAITLSREAPVDIGGARLEYGDAWNAGYSLGEGLEDKVSGMFGMDSAYTETGAGTLYDAVDGIASNTSDMVSISSENLKYLRDIAEQEAVNRFTTAEIKVDMTNNNNISSKMDIDGIITTLTDGLLEAMAVTAEGAY